MALRPPCRYDAVGSAPTQLAATRSQRHGHTNDSMPSRSDRHRSPFRLFFALGFLIAAAVVWALRAYFHLPLLVCYLVGVNFTTVCAYAYDKAAAVRDFRRVPERLLNLCAAAGGTPAALLSQKIFHHKTVKRSFQMWFWGICAAQLTLLAAWIYFGMADR